MTQHLLLQAREPATLLPQGFTAIPVAQLEASLQKAAAAHFGARAAPVWKVSPIGGEMDDPVDQAREALLSGVNVEVTAIGQLLQRFVAAKCSFCLFWASDYSDLPVPQSPHELLSLVSAQLQPVGSSNWEIYVHWQANA